MKVAGDQNRLLFRLVPEDSEQSIPPGMVEYIQFTAGGNYTHLPCVILNEARSDGSVRSSVLLDWKDTPIVTVGFGLKRSSKLIFPNSYLSVRKGDEPYWVHVHLKYHKFLSEDDNLFKGPEA